MDSSIHVTDALSLLRFMDAEADLIFTSPPYNIGSGGPRRDGQRKHGGYDPKSYAGVVGYPDKMPEAMYQSSQTSFLRAAAAALKPDGVLVYNHKPRRVRGVMVHPMAWIGQVPDLTLMDEIVWDRGSTHNCGNHLFWPTTERLYVLRRTEGRYRLDHKRGRLTENAFKRDLWRIPLSSRPYGGHACPFAEDLATLVILAFTRPGDLVCDPYAGSGTTGVAALRNGCRFVGSERDPGYAELARQRLAGAA